MQSTAVPAGIPASSSGVMPRIKEATNDLHTKAERSDFQQRLVRGVLHRELYAAWLAQLLLVHSVLENEVRNLVGARPEFASFVREELFQAPRLHEDLAFFGLSESLIEATPA